MISRALLLVLVSGTVLTPLTGCKVGPDYAGPPTVQTPERFGALPDTREADVTTLPGPGDAKLASWWKTLGDPTLDGLVDRALQGNLDLRLAQARVREARAARGITAADWFPTLDAGGGYSRSRASDNSVSGLGNQQPSEGVNQFTAGLDSTWEIDFWGRTSRGVEAADAVISGAIESRRDVMVLLLAEVARNYVDLRALQERLAVAQRSVRVQEDSLAITQSRFTAGLVGELDVAQARAQLEVRRSQVPPIRAGIDQAINRLSVLLGQPPRSLAGELVTPGALPKPPDAISVGLPSELLQRRPDIRAAERNLAAATARVGVATADLYPRFSISSALGLQSQEFGPLFNLSSRYWSVAPGVSWPILDWGKIRSNIDVQDARVEQAMIQYERIVLASFEDVESSLLTLVTEQQRLGSLTRAVDAGNRAVQLAEDLYRTGNVDFRTVLENQRTLFDAEDAAVQAKASALRSVIGLYKALGGGWESTEQDLAAAAATTPSSTLDAVARSLRERRQGEASESTPTPATPQAEPTGETSTNSPTPPAPGSP